MDIAELRREALRKVVTSFGGFAKVVSSKNLSPSQASYLSQLTSKDSAASFGEKSARNWEQRLGLPINTLVTPELTQHQIESTAIVVEEAKRRYVVTHAAGAGKSNVSARAIAIQLGKMIASADSISRKVIPSLLAELAEHPEDAEMIGLKLEALMTAGNEEIKQPTSKRMGT